MHELSIALSILEVAEKEAKRQGDPRVCAIHLKLGGLSGVVREALLSAYDMAREDTSLRETALIIEEVPVIAYCDACVTETIVVSIQEMCCANCGAPVVKIVGGQELEIVALEIEE